MGVRELWRLHGRKGTRELRVDFIALRTGNAPRRLDASEVLEGLTPDDVCEAVEVVRSSPNSTERIEAVARIVRRRRQASVRVREEATAYPAHRGERGPHPGSIKPANRPLWMSKRIRNDS